jgi:hypothetical protein
MQALYWAWSHAIPLRLRPLQGSSPSLLSAAPEAGPYSKHTEEARNSSPAYSATQAGEFSTDYSTGTFLKHYQQWCRAIALHFNDTACKLRPYQSVVDLYCSIPWPLYLLA